MTFSTFMGYSVRLFSIGTTLRPWTPRICECDEVVNFTNSLAENSQINTLLQLNGIAFLLCCCAIVTPSHEGLQLHMNQEICSPGKVVCILVWANLTSWTQQQFCRKRKYVFSRRKYVLISLHGNDNADDDILIEFMLFVGWNMNIRSEFRIPLNFHPFPISKPPWSHRTQFRIPNRNRPSSANGKMPISMRRTIYAENE